MKKIISIVLSTFVAILLFSFTFGCGSSINKEDLAYKMICYVADDNYVDYEDITLISGTLREEEDGNFYANFKVTVNYYTMYYSGRYYIETEEITYTDVTSSSLHGPLFDSTTSFNITEVNNKLHASSNTTDPDVVDFFDIYLDCDCSYIWADWGTDYLEIDTNPYNYDSDNSNSTKYLSAACSAIRRIHTELGLPSYLYNEMLETRALDGRQTYSGSKVNVSWRYHPDSGLEVRYTSK